MQPFSCNYFRHQTNFGLFFFDFEVDLGCTQTEFGFAMGLQLLFWGFLGPVFGVITDKYGGKIAVFIGFLFIY